MKWRFKEECQWAYSPPPSFARGEELLRRTGDGVSVVGGVDTGLTHVFSHWHQSCRLSSHLNVTMSHSFNTRTVTFALNELPSSFASLEELQTFQRVAGERADAKSDGFHCLFGSTRSGWAIYTTRGLLAPDMDALQFLGDDTPVGSERPPVQGLSTYTFEAEYGLTQATVLDSAAIEHAVAQLDRLLSSIQADPMRVYDADEEGMFTGDDVEPALARDYVSETPAFDQQVGGDDGQSADYLCTYLRSMLALLRTAQEQQLGVVHTLKI